VRFGPAPGGIYRRVFKEHQRVWTAGQPGVNKFTLQLPRLLVAKRAQLPHIDRCGTGAD